MSGTHDCHGGTHISSSEADGELAGQEPMPIAEMKRLEANGAPVDELKNIYVMKRPDAENR